MGRTGRWNAHQKGRFGPFAILLIGVLGAGAYTAYYIHRVYREKEIEIRQLKEVVQRLEAESRVAQVIVRDQGVNPKTGRLETTVKFLEIDRDGRTLPPRHFTVEGDTLYFDALVIQFEREYVERGEPLRGKSICLFRRVFGEAQAPEDGFPVDAAAGAGGVPDVYRVEEEPSAFEVSLWKDFWRYASNPGEARGKGIRVIHGEAVYTRFLKKNLYTLTLDHAGGINIRVEPIPRILQDEMGAPD